MFSIRSQTRQPRGAIGAFVMGSRNPDRVSLVARRAKCETVAQMIEQGWDVVSKCRRCELMMQVDLRVIAIVKGPNFSLWNRYGRCRRLMCNSVVDFMAKAPGMSWHELLSAPWPDDERPPPAWMTARRKD